jgi:hypothetical protein
MLVTDKLSNDDGLLTFVEEHRCSKHNAVVTEYKETPYLWHRRLKHANFDVLDAVQETSDGCQCVSSRLLSRQERD